LNRGRTYEQALLLLDEIEPLVEKQSERLRDMDATLQNIRDLRKSAGPGGRAS
jgi:hypothetical protein